MYVEEAEAGADLRVPPADGAVEGLRGEDGVVDDCQIVQIHDVAHEDVQLGEPVLGVHLVQAHAVVKASHDQLLPHDVSAVHPDLVAPHFVLVPEQDELVLVPRHQDRTQH